MTHTRYVWCSALLTFFMFNLQTTLLHAQTRGEEIVEFGFACPALTHVVLPNAQTPSLDNTTRTTIGVGEYVVISSTQKVAKWEIVNPTFCSGEIIESYEKSCKYETSVDPCLEVIIRATFEGSCEAKEKKIKVIAPEKIVFEKQCGYHEKDVYDVGLLTKQLSILPKTVSFAWLSISEKEAYSVGTGQLTNLNGLPHNASGIWVPCQYTTFLALVDPVQGTLLPNGSRDDAYVSLSTFGFPNGTPANSQFLGTVSWTIPWNYAKTIDLFDQREIEEVVQECVLGYDVKKKVNTMEMKKSTESHFVKVSQNTVSPVLDPTGKYTIDCK